MSSSNRDTNATPSLKIHSLEANAEKALTFNFPTLFAKTPLEEAAKNGKLILDNELLAKEWVAVRKKGRGLFKQTVAFININDPQRKILIPHQDSLIDMTNLPRTDYIVDVESPKPFKIESNDTLFFPPSKINFINETTTSIDALFSSITAPPDGGYLLIHLDGYDQCYLIVHEMKDGVIMITNYQPAMSQNARSAFPISKSMFGEYKKNEGADYITFYQFDQDPLSIGMIRDIRLSPPLEGLNPTFRTIQDQVYGVVSDYNTGNSHLEFYVINDTKSKKISYQSPALADKNYHITVDGRVIFQTIDNTFHVVDPLHPEYEYGLTVSPHHQIQRLFLDEHGTVITLQTSIEKPDQFLRVSYNPINPSLVATLKQALPPETHHLGHTIAEYVGFLENTQSKLMNREADTASKIVSNIQNLLHKTPGTEKVIEHIQQLTKTIQDITSVDNWPNIVVGSLAPREVSYLFNSKVVSKEQVTLLATAYMKAYDEAVQPFKDRLNECKTAYSEYKAAGHKSITELEEYESLCRHECERYNNELDRLLNHYIPILERGCTTDINSKGNDLTKQSY
jgi:hypothetical protein